LQNFHQRTLLVSRHPHRLMGQHELAQRLVKIGIHKLHRGGG
jgi:hypothetical protein